MENIYNRTDGCQEDIEVLLPRATKENCDSSRQPYGRMCPVADKLDKEAIKESNLLTNICPQDRNLNSGLWNAIERNKQRNKDRKSYL